MPPDATGPAQDCSKMVQNGEKQRLCTADDMLNRLAVWGRRTGRDMYTQIPAYDADGPATDGPATDRPATDRPASNRIALLDEIFGKDG